MIGFSIPYFSNNAILKYIRFLVIFVGFILLILGTSMYVYGIKGKFKMRDFILGKIAWKGNESVLDIGTGRGIYMTGAAKHLISSKSIGIDIWRAEDLSGNNGANAYNNAVLENVRDKVEIKNEDARKLNFQDNSCDIIL